MEHDKPGGQALSCPSCPMAWPSSRHGMIRRGHCCLSVCVCVCCGNMQRPVTPLSCLQVLGLQRGERTAQNKPSVRVQVAVRKGRTAQWKHRERGGEA